MKVSEYRTRLNDLETKQREVQQIHDQYAYGYAKTVLANALAKLTSELNSLLNMDLMPVPSIIKISSADTALNLVNGTTQQLSIMATLSNGSLKDVTRDTTSYAVFNDADEVFNNVGMLLEVEASKFMGAVNETFTVTKTTTGFTVTDSPITGGLQVIPMLDESSNPIPNKFEIATKEGFRLGIEMTFDGNQAIGDNYRIDVKVEPSGTVYASTDTSVVTVSATGLVTAVEPGTANVTVQNGTSFITIPVTVS